MTDSSEDESDRYDAVRKHENSCASTFTINQSTYADTSTDSSQNDRSVPRPNTDDVVPKIDQPVRAIIVEQQEVEVLSIPHPEGEHKSNIGSTLEYLRQNETDSHESSGEDDTTEDTTSQDPIQEPIRDAAYNGINDETNEDNTTSLDYIIPPLTPRTQAQIEHDEYQHFLLNAQELIEIEKLSGSPISRKRGSILEAEHTSSDDIQLRENDNLDARPVSATSSNISANTDDHRPSLVSSSAGSTSTVNKRRSLFGSVAVFGSSGRASLISSKSSQELAPSPVKEEPTREEEADTGDITPRPTTTHFRQASEGYKPDPKPPGYFTHNRWNSGYDYVDSNSHSYNATVSDTPAIPEHYNDPEPSTPRQDKEYEAAVHRMSSLERLQSDQFLSEYPAIVSQMRHIDADSILDAYGTDQEGSMESLSQTSVSSTPPQSLSPVRPAFQSPAPRIRSSTTVSRPEDIYTAPVSPSKAPPLPVSASISIAERRSRFEAATAAATAKNATRMVNMRPPRPLSRYSLSSSQTYGGTSREGSEERPTYAKRPE